MTYHQLTIPTLVVIFCAANQGQGAIELQLTQRPDPAPGLQRFTAAAIGTANEQIDTIGGVVVNGLVHQVWASDGVGGFVANSKQDNAAIGPFF